MKTSKLFVVSVMIMSLLMLFGCGSKESNMKPASIQQQKDASSAAPSTVNIPAPEKKEITLRLNWKVKGEFTPFFITKEKGIFEKYGLNVKVEPGTSAMSALQVAAQRKDDFAVSSTVEPIQGISENMPVRMIASYMTRSPLMIASFKDNPVKVPKDLEGKKIAMSTASTFTSVFDKFLTKNSVDPAKVTALKMETSVRNTTFLTKEADAVGIFSTNELPLFEQKLGVQLQTLYLKDFGFDLVDLTLSANTDFLKENPNTTKRFLAAINEGFAYTGANPEESAKLMKKLYPEAVDEKLFVEQIKRTSELAQNQNSVYGWISDKNISDTLDILKSSGMIKERKDMNQYFTNDYLPMKSK